MLTCVTILDREILEHATLKSVTRERYTAEFKAQAVGLGGLGRPVPEMAEDLGIGTRIVDGWVRKGSPPG